MINAWKCGEPLRSTELVLRLPEAQIKQKTPAPKALKIFICAITVFLIIAAATIKSRALSLDSILEGDPETLKIIVMLTIISLLPSLLIMLTGFTRIVIVLSIVRNAVGLQNMPPNTVIIGLALFVTFFVMSPVINQVKDQAYEPYVQGEITLEEFAQRARVPLREFMFKQIYTSDKDFFSEIAGVEDSSNTESIPDRVVIASFVTSELKHAFAIGFFIYIPFIVIDMVVSSTLMAMGMMMLPPAMISMPFKILLFVLVDGWQLAIGTLIKSFAA